MCVKESRVKQVLKNQESKSFKNQVSKNQDSRTIKFQDSRFKNSQDSREVDFKIQAQNQEVFNVKYVTNQDSTQEAKKINTLRQN